MKQILALVVLALVPSLFAARPIARWDVVPHQRTTEVFKAGVVAFHDSALKVVFSVNGRKAYIAKRPVKNERTGVVEYVFPFDPAKYPDGPVTLSAEAVSEGGESFKLPDLPLYANAKGTLGSKRTIWVDPVNGNEFADGSEESPLKSIRTGVAKAGDGGTVYLLPGVHQMKLIGGGKDRKYWTSVLRAPGVDRSKVRIAGGRSGTEKLRFIGLDLVVEVKPGENQALAIGEGGETMAWFDDCTFTNKGGRDSGVSKPFGNRLRAFVTGGSTHDMAYGPAGELVRGHEIKTIATEAFSGGNCLIVNVKVTDVDASGSEVKDPDFYQGYTAMPNWVEDVIAYNVTGLKCNVHAITARQLRNSAFVNFGVQHVGSPTVVTRFSEGVENVLFSRVRIIGQDWWWMKTESGRDDVRPKDVRLFDVKAKAFTGAVDHAGIAVSAEPLKM